MKTIVICDTEPIAIAGMQSFLEETAGRSVVRQRIRCLAESTPCGIWRRRF